MILPKGTLIPIGGAEDKGTDLEQGVIKRNRLNFFELGILKSVLNEIGKENPNIILVTTASQIPDEVSENYLDAFAKLDCTNVHHLRIRNREDVDTAWRKRHEDDEGGEKIKEHIEEAIQLLEDHHQVCYHR